MLCPSPGFSRLDSPGEFGELQAPDRELNPAPCATLHGSRSAFAQTPSLRPERPVPPSPGGLTDLTPAEALWHHFQRSPGELVAAPPPSPLLGGSPPQTYTGEFGVLVSCSVCVSISAGPPNVTRRSVPSGASKQLILALYNTMLLQRENFIQN